MDYQIQNIPISFANIKSLPVSMCSEAIIKGGLLSPRSPPRDLSPHHTTRHLPSIPHTSKSNHHLLSRSSSPLNITQTSIYYKETDIPKQISLETRQVFENENRETFLPKNLECSYINENKDDFLPKIGGALLPPDPSPTDASGGLGGPLEVGGSGAAVGGPGGRPQHLYTIENILKISEPKGLPRDGESGEYLFFLYPYHKNK